MGFRDLLVRIERGCANDASAVSTWGPSVWDIVVLTSKCVQPEA
jgi:hypothetical protein